VTQDEPAVAPQRSLKLSSLCQLQQALRRQHWLQQQKPVQSRKGDRASLGVDTSQNSPW
jgi:hypothetical protein